MLTVVPSALGSVGSGRPLEHLHSHSLGLDCSLRVGSRVCVATPPVLCDPHHSHRVAECDVLFDSFVPVCTHATRTEEEGTIEVSVFVAQSFFLPQMHSLLFWMNLSVLFALRVAPAYGVKESDLSLYSNTVCVPDMSDALVVHLQRWIEDHLHRSGER